MFIFLPENSFDLRVTSEAMHYLRIGVDPYAVSLAHQKAEAALGHHKGEAALGHRVFVYLYPPISIELLKALNIATDAPGLPMSLASGATTGDVTAADIDLG
jgi:hypothetical protein